MKKDIARKLIDDIHNVPIFERHILKRGYNILTTYISPMTIWSQDIEVLVDIRRNVFQKALDKFVEEHKDVLRFACFVSGGDFTPYLRFSVKKEYQS